MIKTHTGTVLPRFAEARHEIFLLSCKCKDQPGFVNNGCFVTTVYAAVSVLYCIVGIQHEETLCLPSDNVQQWLMRFDVNQS